jgi:hypothetical protein
MLTFLDTCLMNNIVHELTQYGVPTMVVRFERFSLNWAQKPKSAVNTETLSTSIILTVMYYAALTY